MDACRTCLSSRTTKDISDLQTDVNENNKNSQDIMMFCLGIQITKDSKISTKLCLKCYNKILLFHKFKVLANKNDAYLRSINDNIVYSPKCENDVKDIIKIEEISVNGSDVENSSEDVVAEVKDELEVKEELLGEIDSEDELLSVIRKFKNENLADESKENAPVKHKRGRPRSITKKKYESKIQICDTCGKPVRNLKDHLKTHIADHKNIPCKVCDKKFSSTSSRYRHHRVKHLGLKQHCDVCGKDVVSLKQHVMVAHNYESLPFECVVCGRRFLRRSIRDLHAASHFKDRPFECDVCANRYRTKLALAQHKSHTKEKPCKCPDCGKCFSSTTILKNHRLVHSDVKPYTCTECGMMFSRSGYLRNHMISHTKEKRYPCRYCAVRFGRSDHRKRHEYTAHERHARLDPS